jgi:hypothetical protein
MRKSRQPRCTAANSPATAWKTPKLLEADQNLSCAIRGAASAAMPRGTQNRRSWQQVEQSLHHA